MIWVAKKSLLPEEYRRNWKTNLTYLMSVNLPISNWSSGEYTSLNVWFVK